MRYIAEVSHLRADSGALSCCVTAKQIMKWCADGALHAKAAFRQGTLKNLEVKVMESQKYKVPGCVWFSALNHNPEFTGDSARE